MSETKKKLEDDFGPITLGFCAALRSKEYFLFLQDVFVFMNKVQQEIDPGPMSETYFIDKIYKSKALGKNWLKIVSLYERNYAPIKHVSIKLPPSGILKEASVSESDAKNKASEDNDSIPEDETNFNEDLKRQHKSESLKTREQLEYDMLMMRLNTLYPPPDGLDDDMKRLAKYFLSRQHSNLEEDFRTCVSALEVTCLRLGSFQSLKDAELNDRDPKKALEKKDERLKKIRSLFSKASQKFVNGASSAIKDLLTQKNRNRRIPFLAGSSDTSLDYIVGGIHAAGLICFIGGTSGFKTGLMSSLCANHILDNFIAGREAASIWGYIGEDGVEAYARRMLTNMLNRKPFINTFEKGHFNIGEFNNLMSNEEDTSFRDTVFELIDSMFTNTFWIKPPEDPKEKLTYSVVNILESFDAQLESGAVRPKFIIIDYLNLLTLPRGHTSNRAQEVSSIAHMLDEWSQQKGIPIITSVQASATGAVSARDMRFFNQEDIHECKSIQHHCRMMVSLLPFTDYSDPEKPTRWLGLHFLKNRDGEKDKTFVCGLYEGHNITLADSKYYTEAEWANHKNNIIQKKNEVFGIELEGAGGKKGFGQQQRKPMGGGGAQKKPAQGGGAKSGPATEAYAELPEPDKGSL